MRRMSAGAAAAVDGLVLAPAADDAPPVVLARPLETPLAKLADPDCRELVRQFLGRRTRVLACEVF